jgi:hypothetical protein
MKLSRTSARDSLPIALAAGRLLALFHNGPARNLGAPGPAWYDVERTTWIADAARSSGRSIECVATVAAVLSPATGWSLVKRELAGFIGRALAGDPCPRFPTYSAQRVLAARVAVGNLGPDAARGPKVGPFARALCGDLDAVVIDRHSARLALGDFRGDGVSARQSRIAAEAHRRAARVLKLSPRDLQALLWVAAVGFEGDTGGARTKARRKAERTGALLFAGGAA